MGRVLQHSQVRLKKKKRKQNYRNVVISGSISKIASQWLPSLGTTRIRSLAGYINGSPTNVCQVINRCIAFLISNSNWVFLWEFLSNGGEKV